MFSRRESQNVILNVNIYNQRLKRRNCPDEKAKDQSQMEPSIIKAKIPRCLSAAALQTVPLFYTFSRRNRFHCWYREKAKWTINRQITDTDDIHLSDDICSSERKKCCLWGTRQVSRGPLNGGSETDRLSNRCRALSRGNAKLKNKLVEEKTKYVI